MNFIKTTVTAIALFATTSAFAATDITRVVTLESQTAEYASLFAQFDSVLVKSQTQANNTVSCSVTGIKNGVEVSSTAKSASVTKFNKNPLAACLRPAAAQSLVNKA